MDVAIIGAGASGLVCAIYASKNNNVTIYEKNNKALKKLLITGNGRCNYFNDVFDITKYNSSNLDILNCVINEENKMRVLNFFDSIGIVPKIVNGYYYPVTNQAITIKEALICEAKNRGVKFCLESDITSIEYQDNKFILNNNIKVDKVVLATGSKAAPLTGSTGDGYKFASKFNHSIIDILPSLVQLKGDKKYYKDWAGIRLDVSLKLYEDNCLVKESNGEIQLTDYGISGICVFELSSHIVKGLNKGKTEEVRINFVPWLNTDISKYLYGRSKVLENRTISNLLDGMINYKLVNLILSLNKIDSNKLYSDLTKTDIDNICMSLTSFKVNITGYNDFAKAQVCSGGIPLTEINIDTFESKLQKNLYIIGEVLDVDGTCGGYNLGFAWISGMIAGENI